MMRPFHLASLALLATLAVGCHLFLPLSQDDDGSSASDVDVTARSDVDPGDHTVEGRLDCEQCPLGCEPDNSACRQFTPSNLDSDVFTEASQKACGDVAFNSDAKILTDDCTVQGASTACSGSALPQAGTATLACLVAVRSLKIHSGVVVRVEGVNPLIVVASGEVVVEGTLDGAALGHMPGPGGQGGGKPSSPTDAEDGQGPGGGKVCSCTGINTDDCGGGGGGFGTTGARGGQEGGGCGSVPPGATYGNESLVPLVGGSGGASGHNASADGQTYLTGAGGAGGGAIQISSQHRIEIGGHVTVGGGGGQQGGTPGVVTQNDRAGGGGGSGGAIVLEAPQITGTGWLAANGGGGGAGANTDSHCSAGEDGSLDSAVAQGGSTAGGSATCSAGGDGAAQAQPAQQGADAQASSSGGGGGGGLGRIRLNWYSPKYPPPLLQVSGQVSTGTLEPG